MLFDCDITINDLRKLEDLIAIKKDSLDKSIILTNKELVEYTVVQTLITWLHTKLINLSCDDIIDLTGDYIGSLNINESDILNLFTLTNLDLDSLKVLGVDFEGSKYLVYLDIIDKLLENVKILDLSMGSGSFLTVAMEKVGHLRYTIACIKAYVNGNSCTSKSLFEFKRYCALNNLFGVDISRSAVDLAKCNMLYGLLKDFDSNKFNNHTKILDKDMLPNLDLNLVVCNSLPITNDFRDVDFDLLDKLKSEFRKAESSDIQSDYMSKITSEVFRLMGYGKTCNYKDISELDSFFIKYGGLEFLLSEFKTDDNTFNFDIVLGNPPYLGSDNMGYSVKKDLKNYVLASDSSNLLCNFLERGLMFTANGGLLGYVTTNKWMTSGYAKNMRKYVLENTEIKGVFNFTNTRLMEGVDTSVVFIRKNTGCIENKKNLTWYANDTKL